MKHPCNKGERNYQKKFLKEKIKKGYATGEFKYGGPFPVYAANRGRHWSNLKLDCDFDSSFYNDFRNMTGIFANEPFYICSLDMPNRKRYLKKVARRKARRENICNKKSNSYKKCYPLYWELF